MSPSPLLADPFAWLKVLFVAAYTMHQLTNIQPVENLLAIPMMSIMVRKE
jgi:hypothetical protein